MIPAQKVPKTKRKVVKKLSRNEEELQKELLEQRVRPLERVDLMEFYRGLKPTSEFYKQKREQRISANGSDDSGEDKGGSKEDEEAENDK